MRRLCAWCCREGKPGYLGEREPFDNPEPTHGICDDHKAQFLESLPSRSFPDVELLIVVRRDNTALYEKLKRVFATFSSVEVILDRRVTDRRAQPGEESHERRHLKNRRIRKRTNSPLGSFAGVRFTPKERPAAEPLEVD